MYQSRRSPPVMPPPRRRTQTVEPPHPQRRLSPLRIAMMIGLVVTLAIGLPHFAAAAQQHHNQQQAQQRQADFSKALSAAIDPVIAAHHSGTVGVAITDPATAITRTYGSSGVFEAASTSKLITALAYYHAAEKGDRNLNTMVGSFSAQFQLQQMVNQSNNESWHLLADYLGDTSLQHYAKSIGSDYTVGKNTVSPASMAQTLAKLSQGKLLSSPHTTQLLSYMQQTNDDTMIPAAMPNGVTVYHKYGLLNGNLHDVAILRAHNTTFSLAIYTHDTDDQSIPERSTMIAHIARAAAEVLFSSKNPHYYAEHSS